MDWLIEDWLPIGDKEEDTSPEGSFKTIWGCYRSVCIASGNPILGHNVKQGTVLIIDEETPKASLENHLDRFSKGFGLRGYTDLPIYVSSKTEFRFGRKTKLDEMLNIIKQVQPVFIRLDSLIAMLPSGRQSIVENDSKIGEIIRDELNAMLSASSTCSTSLSAHAKKHVAELSLEELKKQEMVSLVRGHGSIVGEGCDTGIVLKKISEYPEPTRFAIITYARRSAIRMSGRTIYIEMQEEGYGKGWAKLIEIPEAKIPPSKLVKELYPLFLDNQSHASSEIVKTFALYKRTENRLAVEELVRRKVILNGTKPGAYILNPRIDTECDDEYLKALKK